MEKKALFFDIDGTLIGKKGFIPESAKRALLRAREIGHLVFINTGRSYGLAREAVKNFETDGLLCGCGTELIIEGETVFERLMKPETVSELLKDSPIMDFDLCIEGHEGVLYGDIIRTSEAIRLREFTRREGALLEWDTRKNLSFNKFCIQADEKTDLGSFMKKYSEEFFITDRGGGFFECVPAGCSKATALDFVLESYGITRDNAYAFGDSANDIPMLAAVPHAVIMGDHDAETEVYADFITKSLTEDGIAYAMESLGII